MVPSHVPTPQHICGDVVSPYTKFRASAVSNSSWGEHELRILSATYCYCILHVYIRRWRSSGKDESDKLMWRWMFLVSGPQTLVELMSFIPYPSRLSMRWDDGSRIGLQMYEMHDTSKDVKKKLIEIWILYSILSTIVACVWSLKPYINDYRMCIYGTGNTTMWNRSLYRPYNLLYCASCPYFWVAKLVLQSLGCVLAWRYGATDTCQLIMMKSSK